MPNVNANGAGSSAPLLMVMGLGAQMILWDEEFCEQLATRGHYVIRFDNRDIGLSTKFDDAGVPNIIEAMAAAGRGEKIKTAYTLDDMADDSAGLLDALGIDKAHICGASMGGMIVQTIAIRHPSRVLSLTSIMSTTGNPDLPLPKPEAMNILMTPAPTEREAFIEHSMKVWRTIAGPGFPLDEEMIRRKSELSYDRSFYPEGTIRQLLAIMAHGSRKSALANVAAPTLVIHGADDPLVPVEAGKDTAESIPGAQLMIIDGMGHDLPREIWPRIADAISSLTHKATAT